MVAQKASDPIQQLFVDKVREYATKKKSLGGDKLVEATPQMENDLNAPPIDVVQLLTDLGLSCVRSIELSIAADGEQLVVESSLATAAENHGLLGALLVELLYCFSNVLNYLNHQYLHLTIRKSLPSTNLPYQQCYIRQLSIHYQQAACLTP